jgi:hypothetical protein
MNKPIAANKAVTDLWSMTQMLVEEAVLAEREECAKVCDEYGDEYGEFIADVIRSRGQA